MKTKQDPTGQAKNRKRGERALRKRLNDSQVKIVRIFNDIPRKRKVKTDIRNAAETTTVYEYEISAEEKLALAAAILFILYNELLES